MTDEDRRRWDEKYSSRGPAPVDAVGPPAILAPYANVFPTAGEGLDLACGQGLAAIWLARRGLTVLGLDISEVAIDQARDLARRNGVGDRCRFDAWDLDDGLPDGPPVDVVLCHKFRDSHLDRAIIGTPGSGRATGDRRAQRNRRRPWPVPRKTWRATRCVRRTRSDCRRRRSRLRVAACASGSERRRLAGTLLRAAGAATMSDLPRRCRGAARHSRISVGGIGLR